MPQKCKRCLIVIKSLNCDDIKVQTLGNLTVVDFTKFSVKTTRVSVLIQYEAKFARFIQKWPNIQFMKIKITQNAHNCGS